MAFIDCIMFNWLVPWLSTCLIVHFADITRLGLFTHLYKHVAHDEEQPTEGQASVVIRQSWRTAVSLHSDAKRGQPTNCASKLGRLRGPHCKFQQFEDGANLSSRKLPCAFSVRISNVIDLIVTNLFLKETQIYFFIHNWIVINMNAVLYFLYRLFWTF